MRLLILATALGAVALSAAPASAQWRGNNREVRQEQRECQRELRRADSRREYRRELRECRREIAAARHGRHNRWDDDRRGNRGNRYWDGHRWRNR